MSFEHDFASGTLVCLPDGQDGVVMPAPWGDWLAPDQHIARLANRSLVYVEWRVDGGMAGCWWRPQALSLIAGRPRQHSAGPRSHIQRSKNR